MTTTTTTRMTITTTTTEKLLLLMVWLSPAFPTGGFAYSHGIEQAIEDGDIVDEASFGDWLRDICAHGAARSDAILLRHAWRAEDVDALAGVAELAASLAPGRERQAETLAQGAAFCLAAQIWPCAALAGLQRHTDRIAYPVAVGALAKAHGIDQDAACAAFAQGFMANLISAGVRLIPLGQTAGLRLLDGLKPAIMALVAATRGAPLENIGSACWRADIASLRHETQYTRLFRS